MSDPKLANRGVVADETSTGTLVPMPPVDLPNQSAEEQPADEQPAEEPVTEPGGATEQQAREAPRPRWWRRPGVRADLAALLGYLTLAGYVTERMWRHLHTYILQTNGTDQTQFEYFLWHSVRVVTLGNDPFFTPTLNAPNGVNLMGNTATLGLHLPLVPVTMLFGPTVSFTIMVTLSLFGTAAAWYWLFSRHVVTSRFAAFVGAGFCGFAPGMISQANGHPNISFQVLVPVIIWRVIQLRTPGKVLRNGLLLGLLVTYQAFINEEVLFVVALACALFLGVWAWHHRAQARAALPTFLRALGLAGLVAGALLAYPLYYQFFGPRHYRGLWFPGADRYGTDLVSFVSFSRSTFAGYPGPAAVLSENPSEQNSFFGWPLVVLCLVLFFLFRKRVVVRAAVFTGVVLAILSLGPLIQFHGRHTQVPGPLAPLRGVPIFDSMIATRLVLGLVPPIGLLLALWFDEMVVGRGGADREQNIRGRLVAGGLVVAALFPIAPTPIPTSHRAPTPVFFTSGEWRPYVPAGRTVVTVPVTSLAEAMEGMRWSTSQHMEFNLAGGYFLGPDSTGRGMFGAPVRPTRAILDDVAKYGGTPKITDADRARTLADLRFWKAALVVMGPRPANEAKLRTVMSELLGFSPRWVDGLWLWDVRPLVGY
jgi:hypothetical protein